jgi:hypothetical protein
MPRTGVIGEQIFEQVEKLVAGGMNRTQAFAKISADSGRQAGTVAANYYRVARKRGTTAPRRRRKTSTARSAPARRPPRSRKTGGDIDALTSRLVDDVQALANAMKSQATEVEDLRKRLDGVRKLLG